MLTMFSAGTTESPPVSPPLPPPNPNLDRFARIRQTAASISDRVRDAMTPQGFRPVRVLVVDDHPDAAEALAAVLDMLGCPVRACQDARSALEVARHFDPQICLLDLMMPGMSGLELASRLKVQAGGRPLFLVATTALGDIEAKTRTALAGFHYHLTKPVDVPTLIDVLTKLSAIFEPPAGPSETDTPAD
ncbi:MAG: response regulator [Planctomycetia bacterium]|nr:response regulator [Planctomycetia bacterium]